MRDSALFDTYVKVIGQISFPSQMDAIEYVRKSPAPRFFIDGDFCNIVINRMLRGVECTTMGYNGRRKFDELYRRYKETRSLPQYAGLSPQQICDIIVDQPAPEFYISARTARFVLAKERERRWEKGAKN